MSHVDSSIDYPEYRYGCHIKDLEPTGYYNGDTIRIMPPADSPNGDEWKWWECAHECTMNTECEFWILQTQDNPVGNDCYLRKNKGSWNGIGLNWTGDKSPNCLGQAVNCCTGSLDGNDLHCTRDGCVLASSYEEARTHCLLLGMRVCTLNELESRECCSEDCGFDSSLSWTSDRCDNEATSGGVSYVDIDPGLNSLCTGNDLCQDYAAGILCTVSESVARYVHIHFFLFLSFCCLELLIGSI